MVNGRDVYADGSWAADDKYKAATATQKTIARSIERTGVEHAGRDYLWTCEFRATDATANVAGTSCIPRGGDEAESTVAPATCDT